LTRHLDLMRAELRRWCHEAEVSWEGVLPADRARNLAIARAFVETDEPTDAIAARHGLSPEQALAIAHIVVYFAHERDPRRR
jgi:hypothetical protein